MLLLLASLTHRDEWHLYYCLALFIRYGVAAEKHFREFDFLLYLFLLTFASGIISLALYRLAFLISGNEKYNNVQILGFSGECIDFFSDSTSTFYQEFIVMVLKT